MIGVIMLRKRYKPFFKEEIHKTDGGFFRGEYKGKKEYFQTEDEAKEYEANGAIEDQIADKKEKNKSKKIGHVNEHGYEYNDHDSKASSKKHAGTWEVKNKDGKIEYAVKDEDVIHTKSNPEGVVIFKSKKEREKYLNKIKDPEQREKKKQVAMKKDQASHREGDIWTTDNEQQIAVKYKDKKGKVNTVYLDIDSFKSKEDAMKKAHTYL